MLDSRSGPRIARRKLLTRLSAVVTLTAGLLAGGPVAAHAATTASPTANDHATCPVVTGTVSPTPTANWLSQQASQSFATAELAASPRTSKWVTLDFRGATMKAWVDYPLNVKKAPVVLVMHEVFGLTDSTRETADQLAAMGYIAITPDMISGLGPDGAGDVSTLTYDGGQASDLMTAEPDYEVDARIAAWVHYAEQLPGSTGQTDIVGLSWGGGAAFRYATTGTKSVNAIFVFYDVGPPQETQGCDRSENLMDISVDKIAVPIYGFYGGTDTRVIPTLPATEQAMAAAGKFYQPVVYPDADHAYMRLGNNPAEANPADAAAEADSLKLLQQELKQSFVG